MLFIVGTQSRVTIAETRFSSHGPAAGEASGEPYRLGDAGEFRLEADVAGMLYTYQLEGVAWLYRLHTLQRGGILAGGHRSSLHTCLYAQVAVLPLSGLLI